MYVTDPDFSLTHPGSDKEHFSVNWDRITSGSVTSEAKDELTEMGTIGL